MTQSLALSSSTQNSEKLNQVASISPPELSFQFTYSSMVCTEANYGSGLRAAATYHANEGVPVK